MTITNLTDQTPRLSVSTWSLHRVLGESDFYGPESGRKIPVTTGESEISLLDLPARIAAFGIHTLEICHFHLPSRDKGYLNELRSNLEAAEVELFSLLIDHGDITHPDHAERDRRVDRGRGSTWRQMRSCHRGEGTALRCGNGDEPRWTTTIDRTRKVTRCAPDDRELVCSPFTSRTRDNTTR